MTATAALFPVFGLKPALRGFFFATANSAKWAPKNRVAALAPETREAAKNRSNKFCRRLIFVRLWPIASWEARDAVFRECFSIASFIGIFRGRSSLRVLKASAQSR